MNQDEFVEFLNARKSEEQRLYEETHRELTDLIAQIKQWLQPLAVRVAEVNLQTAPEDIRGFRGRPVTFEKLSLHIPRAIITVDPGSFGQLTHVRVFAEGPDVTGEDFYVSRLSGGGWCITRKPNTPHMDNNRFDEGEFFAWVRQLFQR